MNPTIISGTARISARANLEYVEIGHGIAVFRLTRLDVLEGRFDPMLKQHVREDRDVRQGFAYTKTIDAYVAGKEPLTEAPGIILVPPNFLKHVASLGWSRAFDECTKEAGLESWNDFPHEPYVELVQNGVSVERVIRIDGACNMVFALDGTVLPTAIHFDYINAHFNEGGYDLPKALEILKKKPRVRFLDRRGWPTNQGEVLEVEYYNNRPWNSKYLRFWYEPTQEEAVKLWDKQRSYGTKYPSTEVYRAMFDLDILGLRAGGAAYYESFHENRAYDDAYKAEQD